MHVFCAIVVQRFCTFNTKCRVDILFSGCTYTCGLLIHEFHKMINYSIDYVCIHAPYVIIWLLQLKPRVLFHVFNVL